MNEFTKLTKNPITWIVCIFVCIIGLIVLGFKSKRDE